MKLTHQLKRFILAGLVNTLFGYLVYAFGVVILQWPYFWSILLSYVVGVSFSYLMFRHFVFTEGERGWKSYVRFIPTYIILFFVNMFSLFVLVDMLGWNSLIAQVPVIALCAALSFVANRIFVFRHKPRSS